MDHTKTKTSDLFLECSKSKQRRLQLMKDGHLCDCEFIVGRTKKNVTTAPEVKNDNPSELRTFKAHRMVLATASAVFERLFYGAESLQFTEQSGEHGKQWMAIRIDDITPEIFEIFLTYIYTYDFEVPYLTVERCQMLLYVGYKYMTEDFIEACVQALKGRTWMMPEVLPLFELACFYNNLSLLLLSYEKIRLHAAILLDHQSFFDLNVHNLKRIIVLLSKDFEGRRLLRALERYDNKNGLKFADDASKYLDLLNAVDYIDFHMEKPQSYLLIDSFMLFLSGKS